TWNTEELLSHTRHDWLNYLQLIKTNLALNRPERAKAIIEEITAKSRSESQLTQLKIPRIAVMLMTFNWGRHPYRLEYEVSRGERVLHDWEDELYEGLISLFDHMDEEADESYDNHVLLTLHTGKENFQLTIAFKGFLHHPDKLNETGLLHKSFRVIEHYTSNEEWILTVIGGED
ncbi:MAG TPA: Spo0B C-terminal domain-containing protein, partial [Bacillales bacterium]|nr:Spo0B C-terminal domain-containing protein [Bacillales bacterium]